MLQLALDDESLLDDLRQRQEERRRQDALLRALEERAAKLKVDKDKATQDEAELRERVAHQRVSRLLQVQQIPEGMAIDLLFLLDITSSMRHYRDTVVKQLSVIIAHLQGVYKLALENIRVGVVGYRDFNLTPRFEVLPFRPVSGNGARAIEEWLNALEFRSVRTGEVKNDFPEDVHGGLEKAASAEMGWTNPARSIVHIADAPGHGRRLRDADAKWKDHLLDHDKDGTQLQALLTALRTEVKVQSYLFMHIRSESDGKYFTQAMLQQFAKDCGDPAWIREVEWLDDEEMGLEVVSTVSESMQHSLSYLMENGATGATDHQASEDRQINIVKEQPNWDEIEALPLQIKRHDPKPGPQSIRDLMDMIMMGKHLSTIEVQDTEKAVIKIAPHPFAKGEMRVAYYARYYPKGVGDPWSEVVVKEFIREEENTASCFKAQLETHTVASFMARRFNSHARQLSLDRTMQVPEITYVPCNLICLATTGLNSRQRFFLVEPLLVGEPSKFNNNSGFVNEEDPQPHLQAFSHWTYEVTNRQLMVVDLQGFKHIDGKGNQKITLVDPAIHCTNSDYFGSTNHAHLGGFDMFLETHQAHHGAICKSMMGQDGRSECIKFRDREHGTQPLSTVLAQVAQRVTTTQSGHSQANISTPVGPPGGTQVATARPQMAAAPRDGATSNSVSLRTDAVKEAIRGHALCKKLLRDHGWQCPDYFFDAIYVCEQLRILKADVVKELRRRNKAANDAKHDWNKPGEALKEYPIPHRTHSPNRRSPNRGKRR